MSPALILFLIVLIVGHRIRKLRAGRDLASTSTTTSTKSTVMSPRPCPTDGHPTPTSKMQAETEAVLLKHIPDSNSFELPPTLQKKAHMKFLIRNLAQGFPSRYTTQDASQPWLMFWTVQSFSILQVVLDPVAKQQCVSFFFFNFVEIF